MGRVETRLEQNQRLAEQRQRERIREAAIEAAQGEAVATAQQQIQSGEGRVSADRIRPLDPPTRPELTPEQFETLTDEQQERYLESQRRLQEARERFARANTNLAEDFVREESQVGNRQSNVVNRDRANTNRTANEIGAIRREYEQALSDYNSVVASAYRPNIELRARLNQDLSKVEDNILNNFIMVQYHVALKMLDEESAIEAQRLIVYPDEANNARVYDSLNGRYIASTAETLRDESLGGLDDKNYYNIMGLEIDNVMAPSEQNPIIATMTSMKMKISEPVGFKLHEDILQNAIELGYEDINTGRILYEVQVWFSGYDPQNGSWHDRIPLYQGENTIDRLSYFVALASMEATVESNGTQYDIDLVPAGHFAYRPEEIVVDASQIWTGESDTFGEFLSKFSEALKIGKLNRTDEKIKREYVFHAPGFLLAAPFKGSAKEFGVEKGWLLENQEGGGVLTVGKDVDILTILQAAMHNLPVVQDLFLQDRNNESFIEPRVHWNIRFNTRYASAESDPDLHDYQKIIYEYIIEPFITFKAGTFTPRNLPQVMASEIQVERIRKLLQYGMLRRIYNYIYTSENTEVIDLALKFKTFYYTTINRSYDSQQTSGTTDSRSGQEIDLTREEIRTESQQPNSLSLTIPNFQVNQANQTLRRLFGSGFEQGPSGANRSPFQKYGGGFGEKPQTNFYTGTSQSGNTRKNTYLSFLDEHLKYELLKIEDLKIRGDPVWLTTPYGNVTPDNALQFINSSIGGFYAKVYPRVGNIIFLKILAPNQDDMMNPVRDRASSYPNIIGGFYEVLSVRSVFEGGNFTQNITAVKLNHLNYVEPYTDIGDQPQTATGGDVSASGEAPREAQQ